MSVATIEREDKQVEGFQNPFPKPTEENPSDYGTVEDYARIITPEGFGYHSVQKALEKAMDPDYVREAVRKALEKKAGKVCGDVCGDTIEIDPNHLQQAVEVAKDPGYLQKLINERLMAVVYLGVVKDPYLKTTKAEREELEDFCLDLDEDLLHPFAVPEIQTPSDYGSVEEYVKVVTPEDFGFHAIQQAIDVTIDPKYIGECMSHTPMGILGFGIRQDDYLKAAKDERKDIDDSYYYLGITVSKKFEDMNDLCSHLGITVSKEFEDMNDLCSHLGTTVSKEFEDTNDLWSYIVATAKKERKNIDDFCSSMVATGKKVRKILEGLKDTRTAAHYAVLGKH